MRAISRRAVLAGLTLSGCQHSALLDEVQDVVLTTDVVRLGALDGTSNVGSFFYIDDDKISLILDLRSKLVIGHTARWYSRRAVPVQGEIKQVATVRYQRGFSQQWATIGVTSTRKQIERIIDPFVYTEVLNRPISGELYNRTIDQNVVTWKASLAEVLSRSAVEGRGVVALCIATERLLDPSLVISAPDGLNTETKARLRASTSSALGYSFELSGANTKRPSGGGMVTGALFQRIAQVTSSEMPTIQFSLGSNISIVLSDA